MSSLDDLLNSEVNLSGESVGAQRPSRQAGGNVESFVDNYMPLAQKVSEQTGVAPDILLGQWGLETGWGRSVIPGTNNLGNIKDPTGRGVRAYDKVEGSNDAYRVYSDPMDFGDDFARLLAKKRYEGAAGSGSNEVDYFSALKRGGYATDPNYVNKGVSATNMVRNVLGGTQTTSKSPQQSGGDSSLESMLNAPLYFGEAMRPAAPVTPATTGERIKDVALSFGQGAVGGVQAVSDVFGANNPLSSALGDVSDTLQDWKSDQSKATLQASMARIKEAEEYGSTGDVVAAYMGMLADNPIEMIAQGAGSFSTLALGKIAQAAKLAQAAKASGMTAKAFAATDAGKSALLAAAEFGSKVNKAVSIAQGVGAVKGSQYEHTYNAAKESGLSEDEAKALADDAQRYGGEGALQQILGGGLGYLAAATGPIERVVFGQAGKASGNAASRVLKGGATEFSTEGLQGGQERYAGNDAAIYSGVMDESDRYKGVAGQAMLEGSIGAILGGPVSIFEKQAPDPLQKVREAADKGGVLSKAAVASSDATPTEDPLRARIDALKTDAPTILDALRKSNNPETAKDFVSTMNQAQNPSFSPDMREQMVSQMEAYAAHAKAGVVPGMVLSRETGLSVPPVEQQEQQPAPTDGPLIDGQKVLPDPNVIDVDGRIVDVSSEPSSGQASPTSQPAQAPVSQGVQLTDEVFAPRVAIPADTSPTGDAPAGVRKRKAQIDALAKSGLTTIQKTDSGFVMVNPSTGQYFRLSSPADIAMARNAASVYAQPKGAGNDTGANQAGNRGSDQGVGGGLAEESATTGTAENASPIGQSAGTLGTGEDAGVVTRYSASPEDVNALSLSAKKRGLSVSVEAPPQDAVTGATTRFLQALEKLTGKRGIAVKVTGKNAYDGVQTGKKFYVNVDNPQTSIPFTIAHEFKHMGESFPGLNRLYERMWDRIPEAARREYAKTVEGVDYDSMTPEQMDKLKSEMVADFIGRRFNDRQWLQRLAKEKPNLFAEFVRDWVRLLDSLIGEIKSMLGVVDDRTEAKQIDTLMRNHLKQLEEMKSIAIEVAVEWAKQNPGLAKKSGVNYSTRGYDANAEQDGILSKNRIDGTSGRLDQDSGRPDGQARDGRPDVLGEAGAQRLAVLQPSELRIPGGRGARDGEAGGQAGGRAGYGRSDAQAESGSRNLPEKTERRGFYGQPQEGSVEVTGIHFSQQPRDTLISDFYGTGLKGAERERLSDPKNSDIRPRIYFYVSRGKDIVRESGVGNVMHKVTLRNLYDVTADDLDIVASTRGKGLSEADKSSAWERAVMNAGFDGYVVKDPIQPQWYAVLVGKHQVQPSLDPKQVAEAAEMSKPKPKTRREGDELVATPDSTETVPLIHIKPKINEGAPSFRFQWGAARVLASEADMANAIIESEGLKFKFNMRNSLPEGNAKRVTENLMSDNYKGLDGVMVEVDGKTVDAKQALEQIDRRKDALDMVLECLI